MRIDFQRVVSRILGYRTEVIELQRRLTAIPAIGPESGGQGEAEKAEYLMPVLHRLPCDSIEEVHSPDPRVSAGYRPNILAKIKGKSSKRTLWIMSHMDIVPPGDAALWSTDPYRVTEKEGRLYGRGTEDNHQSIVSSIIAVKALREEKIVPECDIGLALVSDEETGSHHGIGHVLKTQRRQFRAEDFIIIPDAGNEKGTLIEVAEKSILWIRCETQGKQTHGSTPEKGINAHKAAAHLIVRMNGLYASFPRVDSLFDPPISTFEPTKKEGNVENINTIPGSDVFYFDCRILPGYSIETVRKHIEKWSKELEREFGVRFMFSYPQSAEAPPPTPADAPVALALKKSISSLRGVEPSITGIGGGTVAAFFRSEGLPAVCWCTLDDTLHAPNEYCVIDNVLNDAIVFAHLALSP